MESIDSGDDGDHGDDMVSGDHGDRVIRVSVFMRVYRPIPGLYSAASRPRNCGICATN